MAKTKTPTFDTDNIERKIKRQEMLKATGGDRRFTTRSITDKKKQSNKDWARNRQLAY